MFSLVFLVIGLSHFMAIVAFLHGRGEKINWVFIKLFMPRYVRRYQLITERENGWPGQLFYGFIIGMAGTLVMAILGAILK